jgi:hypothetical protein
MCFNPESHTCASEQVLQIRLLENQTEADFTASAGPKALATSPGCVVLPDVPTPTIFYSVLKFFVWVWSCGTNQLWSEQFHHGTHL